MKKNNIFLFVIIAFTVLDLFTLPGCNNNIVSETKKEFNESKWKYSDPFIVQLSNNPHPGIRDIYLEIEHNDDYSYENIYFTIEKKINGNASIDTINVDLADEYGVWKGSGSAKNKKFESPLYENIDPKISELKINQFTRDSILTGINSITLIVKNSQK